MALRPHHRRWTVIASALLCGSLALVVMFTNRRAFYSPLAIVVVAAIGAAAVLLQTRMRKMEHTPSLKHSVWLNILGSVFAVAALFADFLNPSPQFAQTMALGAVASFGIGSAILLHAFRKERIPSKQ
jgi:drug/metabolite transporter (DMT)-like permease